ncbi:MAG TPA: anhydro-N-acetylmuramic acid kinase [Steroidobacteraceae bacterium]|nr:anhydro-N-acetylmuramic acid kinase [Steroidobacteraceae bacterium]
MTLYIGLISGTSMDGVEAVALDIDTGGMQVRGAIHVDYPTALAAELRSAVAHPESCMLDALGSLDARIGEVFGDAAEQLLQKTGLAARQVRAIGSHGQTVLHRPRAAVPFTLQIGDPNRIAERTGIDVVADFRRRDLAAGGEAAPLVPAFHAAAFGAAGEDRAVVNIGGIANITALHADGRVTGFDTGPGNCLMDLWVQEHQDEPYDEDGQLAASGSVEPELLELLLEEPYLALLPPKSTGRELFNFAWLQQAVDRHTAAIADVQATLCEYTAMTIAAGLTGLSGMKPARLLVCGGGAFNGELMRRLAAQLPGCAVEDTGSHGIPPEQVEAAMCAWLAERFVAGQPGNLTAVTGARGPRVLGALHRGAVTQM